MDTQQPQSAHDIDRIDVQTQYEVFKPTKFGVQQPFLYCDTACTGRIDQAAQVVDRSGLTKAEEAYISQCMVQYAREHFGGNGFDIWATVGGKTRFLVDPQAYPEAAEVLKEMKGLRAVLKVYETKGYPYRTRHDDLSGRSSGPDDPRPIFSNDYKRMYLPEDHRLRQTHGLRFRWSKVELWQDTAYDNNELDVEYDVLEKEINEKVGSEKITDFRLYQVEVKIHTKEVSLRDLVGLMLTANNIFQSNAARDLVNAFLTKEYISSESVVRHDNKFYDLTDKRTETLQGLKRVTGAARILGINFVGEVVMLSRSVTNSFLPMGPVSDFLQTRFGQPRSDSDDFYLENMRSTLRGRFVRTSSQTKAIAEIPGDLSHAVVPEHKHKDWPNNKANMLLFPYMPALNLGAMQRPVMMPPELCTLTPMQSIKTKQGIRPQRGAAAVELGQATTSTANTNENTEITDNVVSQSIKKPDASTLDTQFQRLYTKEMKPEFLFVEVTMAHGERAETCSWTKLQHDLAEHIRVKDCEPECKTLSLNFDPADSGLIDKWTEELSKLAKERRPDRKHFLIAAIPAGQHNKRIYQALKNICDMAVGLQSFIVGAGTLGQKLDKDIDSGKLVSKPASSKSPAGNVLHRMRLRNPAMFLPHNPDKGQVYDLAVAVHIAPISKNKDGALSSDLFLISIVARSMESATEYYTDISLVNVDDQMLMDPMRKVAFLLSHAGKPKGGRKHRITVFRSGVMPHKHAAEHGAQLALRVKPSKAPDVHTVSTATAAREFAQLESHLKEFSAEKRIQAAYILVGEDRSIIGATDPTQATAQRTDAGRTPKATTVLRTTNIHDSMREQKASLRHVSLAKDTRAPATVSIKHIGGSVASAAVEEDRSALVDPANAQNAANAFANALERLSSVFRDDHLGLYNTKWPVPTHLARLAADRAELHLARDAAGNLNPTAGLQPIAQGVCDTLYYV
ncbi:uncharacterized protein CLAFUR5_05855 [Fulvia fulva]|uniref:PAZ domain-containing protein n=1 Tax=Passalora fulva TaxID=5499 RepID=A0A9Q8P9K9_PASFU|nr:uncharacterized protein CLAFUR5_05855 [Fulvia fulva]KAK4624962.1 hypothetical protein CLAFUR0_05717 [Fulvia fulva]UJO18268.1 hypothetical protein CLAFUR5_05855 [Fulvia fulva]